MKEPRENRPGYKKTKVGWIPKEWRQATLSSCATIEHGWAFKGEHFTKSGELLVLTPGNFIETGGFRLRGLADRYYSAEFPKKYLLSKGQMLVAMTEQAPGLLGSPAIVPEDNRFLHNQRLGLVQIKDESTLRLNFLYYFLNTEKARRFISLTGAGTKVRHTSPERILKLPVPIPPESEQDKIIAILSSSDKLIEQTHDLIAAKKKQKKALMQQILTERNRLPGFSGEWKIKMLGQISIRLREVVENPGDFPVLSITAGTGFVSQEDKFSRVIAGKQVENYVLLKRGEFAYNKGNSYRYPQGCVYQLTEYEEGLVPDVFYSFKLDKKRADPEFIKQYFLAGLHNKDLHRWINSGVRNNGLLNLNASDFFNLPIRLPGLSEQREIGTVLRAADVEITALESKHAALKQQKKGLMQNLLIGQIRVKD
jgi:type I restriction enzyme S subunit